MSAVEALQGGSHVAVFVLGDSGMGKSRLIEAVVAELGSEVTPVRDPRQRVADARCRTGCSVPFIVGLPVQEATSQLAVLQDAVVAPGRAEARHPETPAADRRRRP